MIQLPTSTPTSKTAEHIPFTAPEALDLTCRWLSANREEDEAAGRKTAIRTELEPMVFRRWLEANDGVADPTASVLIASPAGELLVSMAAAYKKVPDGFPKEHLRQEFGFAIDGDKVPAGVAQAFANDLIALCARYGLSHGKGGALKITNKLVPSPEFGTARHKLGVEVNRMLEAGGLGTKVTFKPR